MNKKLSDSQGVRREKQSVRQTDRRTREANRTNVSTSGLSHQLKFQGEFVRLVASDVCTGGARMSLEVGEDARICLLIFIGSTLAQFRTSLQAKIVTKLTNADCMRAFHSSVSFYGASIAILSALNVQYFTPS